ncbi:hypothetical protein BDB01DRAFT_776018 [Pilobolus umbonatus]|nr:hypothetical protein BDB01DRAFT_776018 [Pilobolus umbonatus]
MPFFERLIASIKQSRHSNEKNDISLDNSNSKHAKKSIHFSSLTFDNKWFRRKGDHKREYHRQKADRKSVIDRNSQELLSQCIENALLQPQQHYHHYNRWSLIEPSVFQPKKSDIRQRKLSLPLPNTRGGYLDVIPEVDSQLDHGLRITPHL